MTDLETLLLVLSPLWGGALVYFFAAMTRMLGYIVASSKLLTPVRLEWMECEFCMGGWAVLFPMVLVAGLTGLNPGWALLAWPVVLYVSQLLPEVNP